MSQKGDVKADAKADSTVDPRATRPHDSREAKFPASQDAAKKAEAEKEKVAIRTSAKFPSLSLGKPSPPPARPTAPAEDEEEDDEYEDGELEDELDDEEDDVDAKPGLLARLVPAGGKNRRAWEFGAGIGALVVLGGTLTMLLWGRLSAKGPPPPAVALVGTGAQAPVKPSAGIGKHDKLQPSTPEGVASRRAQASEAAATATSAVRTAAYDELQAALPSQKSATEKNGRPAPFAGSSPIIDAAANGQAQGGPIPLPSDQQFVDPNGGATGFAAPAAELPVPAVQPYATPDFAGTPGAGFAPPTEAVPLGGINGATAMPAASPFGAPAANDPLAMPGSPAGQADPLDANHGGYSATTAPAGNTLNIVGGQPNAAPATGFAAPGGADDLGFGAPAGTSAGAAMEPAANPLPFGGADAAAGGQSAELLPFDNNAGTSPAASPFGGQPETPATGPAGAVDEPPFGANAAFPAGAADLNPAPASVDSHGDAPAAADPFGAGGMTAQPAATGDLNHGGHSATDPHATATTPHALGGFDNDPQFGTGQGTAGGAPATGFADPATEPAMPAATEHPGEARPYGRPANTASNTIDGGPAGDGWSSRGNSTYGNANSRNAEGNGLSGRTPETNAAPEMGNTFDTNAPADAGYTSGVGNAPGGALPFDNGLGAEVGRTPEVEPAPPAYSAEPVRTPPATATHAEMGAEPTARPTTGDGVESYTIAEYDTYWSIAEKLYGDGGYYKALQAYNGDHGLLRVGQPLAAPRVDVLERRHPELCPSRVAEAAPAAAPTVRVPAAASGAVRKYQVQAGDTLYEIARAELGKGARWVEIYEINREKLGENADSLPAGLELALPSQPSASDAPRVGSQPRIRLR